MPERSDAATAGRGFLVITAAKLWFMVGGVLINFGLPFIFSSRLYGDHSDGKVLYGQYIDINNTLSILSMVMITGVMQAVSRFVAERPDASAGVVRQAFRMMLVVGSLVGGGFIIASPWIADARGNPGLVNGYRAAGVVLLAYGLYTVFIGALNGRKAFFSQALFDIGFTTLKATLVLGGALLGLGVIGALGGFALAALLIMLIAMVRVGRRLGAGERVPGLYAYAAWVMLYALVFNVIFKLDVVVLKPLVADLYAPVSGWLPEGAPVFRWMRERAVEASSDGLIGLYGLAINIARVPWQVTLAVTFVVFPMISESVFNADKDRTRLYIRQTLRYTMILVAAAAVVLAAMPHALVALLPADYAEASVALAWLAPAYFCFALFNVVNTMLMGAGRAIEALIIGVVTCALAAGAYYVLLSGAENTTEILARAGQGTLIAFTLGLALGLAVLARRYGSPVPLATVVRVVGLGTALVIAGRFIPPTGKIVALALAVAIGITFLVGLVLLREFGEEDKARLRRVLRRKS